MSQTPTKWKIVRARILDRDRHRCADCGTRDKALHVHHRYYQDGRKPWEYEDESLVALCPACHGRADELRRRIARAAGLIERGEEQRMLAFLEVRAAMARNRDQNVGAGSAERLIGIAMALQTDVATVERAVIKGQLNVLELEDQLFADAYDAAQKHEAP